MNYSEKIIHFNRNLKLDAELPEGIRAMNPYSENTQAWEASCRFYRKYYNDCHPRKMILGINPGRFGAGVTGIPFTDTRRLEEKCGIEIPGLNTYEPSSVFVYDFIEAFGGVEAFYRQYYISSVSPLGFVKLNDKGKEINYNYYDSRELQEAVAGFITRSIEEQLEFGIDTSMCACLGNNKNYRYLEQLNREKRYFGKIIALEHPRYIMQYKVRQKEEYIRRFVELLR